MTQRTLGEWLAYLEQLHPAAIDMGLDRAREDRVVDGGHEDRRELGRPVARVLPGGHALAPVAPLAVHWPFYKKIKSKKIMQEI